MIRNEAHKGFARKITLFYSNRSPENAACLAELQDLAAAHPNLELVATMTAPQTDDWDGETGRITRSMLERHVQDLMAPTFYCVGPASMVASTQAMLADLGIASSDMRFEQFAGY